jgi:phosphoribosylamine--glycine ligase
MNILLVGSGGREHAIAKKLSESPLCQQLYIAPGNPGTAQCGINVPLAINDFIGIKTFCHQNEVNLVVVGPEAPLVDGITNIFRAHDCSHISVIGPDAHAAQLEGSKAFAKKFMQKYQIPTAPYLEVSVNNLDEGITFLENMSPPYVLKADGLAAGKGVLIIHDLDEAKNELHNMLSGKFGKASFTVVIEQYLDGIEFSVFALTDGKDFVLLPEAKDYKRIGEGDNGLNTGGMGAISPVPFVDEALWHTVTTEIVKPTIDGIFAEGMDYVGFVFFGLIKVGDKPYVIEYNCRLGDPETEVVIPRLTSDLVELLMAAAKKQLSESRLEISTSAVATVILVSGGYPGDFEKGNPITSLEKVSGSTVYHSGTTINNDQLVTSGGRVLAITSAAKDFKDAVALSIKNAEKIQYAGKYFRKDIGFDL